jgi:hypothetical protein
MDEKIGDTSGIDWQKPIADVDPDELESALVGLLLELEFFSRKAGRNRDHYIVALNSVADFLTALRTPEHFAGLFNRLAIELSDLDKGTVAPSLSAEKIVGSRGESYEWMGRCKICLGMVALHAAGQSYLEAAGYIAKHFRKAVSALRSSHAGDAAAAVYSWHGHFTAPKPTNNEMAQFAYAQQSPKIRKHIKSFPETERLRQAHALLKAYEGRIFPNNP